jgi:hypothetical protein
MKYGNLCILRVPGFTNAKVGVKTKSFPCGPAESTTHAEQIHDAGGGQPDAYTGQFYPGPHKFDLEMQSAAFDWLKKHSHS